MQQGSQLYMQSLLRSFPAMRYAFAYGSGAFAQPGLYSDPNVAQAPSQTDENSRSQSHASTSSSTANKDVNAPMLDFIFVVDDPASWHRQNIHRNPKHYSWLLSKLGSDAVCAIADHVGVGVHFNTLVPMGPRMVKYGVASTATTVDDMLTWRHLYLAGRLQKPVAPITLCEGGASGSATLSAQADVVTARQANVESATAAALLLLPERFTTRELLHTVVGISYHGDIRMAFAEDAKKVQRIVTGSWDGLRDMYLPQLQQQAWPGQLAGVEQLASSNWRRAADESCWAALTARLPVCVLHEMSHRLGLSAPEDHFRMADTRQDILGAISRHPGPPRQLLAQSLAAIVRRSSGYQAVAGLLSVSASKSLQYMQRKLVKAWKSNDSLSKHFSSLLGRSTGSAKPN